MSASTNSNGPIVLKIKEHDVSVTHPVTAKSIQLNVNRNGTKINITIDKKSTTIPGHYHDAVCLLLHHLDVYKQISARLTKHPTLHKARNEYTSITYYYCDVLMAFVEEVKGKWRRNSKAWRSAHLDYHLAMLIHNSAFTKRMQMDVLSKINRTWDDFVNQNDYAPAREMTIKSYHNDFCQGQNMCGVDDPSHNLSVEEMVVSVIARSMAPLQTHKEGEQMMDDSHIESSENIQTTVGPVDSAIAGTSSAAVSVNVAEATSIVPSGSSLGAIEIDNLHIELTRTVPDDSKLVNLAPIHFQTKHDRDIARKKRAVARTYASATESRMEQDTTEEATREPDTTVDRRKGGNNRKGGRKDKGTTSGNAPIKEMRETRPRRPVKESRSQAHREQIFISEDEDVIPDGRHATVAESKINKPQTSTNPPSRARRLIKKGKRNAIVLSDDEASDHGPDVTADRHSAAPGNIHGSAATPEDLDTYMDIPLPSAFEEWEDWHRTAFAQGNSQVFLKLATWILLRSRQLTHSAIDGPVEGLLIPDHPAAFAMDNDADYNEALGMTRLYAALAHIDTHPEYLCHLFHEIGKASFEGRLECSHPHMRPLPELPIPVLSMVADAQFPWLNAAPVADDDMSADMDADGDLDMDDDVSISMGLDEMVISTVQHAADPERGDALKRKRTLSKALSPPKASGGRGFPKRPKASRSEAFVRPSSPHIRQTATQSVSTSASSGQTNRKNIVIEHNRSPSEDIVTPGSLARASRALSDISMWTESEEDNPRDTTLHLHGDDHEEITEDPDVATDGPSKVATGISAHVKGRDATSESGEKFQLTCVTTAFDEDVRVIVSSPPE